MKRNKKEPLAPLGEERRSLLHNLQETKRELDWAQLGFDQAVDSDLIEFYLFEINALRARHTYLLRRVKALENPGVSTPSRLAQESPPLAQ